MGEVKQINIKNRTYYFYNDKINIKLVKNWQRIIWKHWYLQHCIYYNKKIDDFKNIYSVNPLYLLVNHASGYIEKEGANKYLLFLLYRWK